jgi:DNA-binding response OmpR family regulator
MYNEDKVIKMKLLIIEDYKKINDLIALFAKEQQHEVKQAFTAEEGLSYIESESFDAVILDLMLPEMQGETLLKKIRSFSDLYVMVISAKIDIKGKIDVLSLGADDYITKPFSADEVMVRLKNVEQRLNKSRPNVISFNHKNLIIYPLKREVVKDNKPITLTEYEYDILFYLSSHPHIVFNREHIIEACFSDSNAYDRVIDAFIKNIRKKIDIDKEQSYIKTHYGIGYEFVGEIDDH